MRGIRAGAVFRTLAIVSAFALVAVACGDDNSDSGGGGGGGEDENVIRFTFAPDPVWDYLKDSGISAQMQEESGITIIERWRQKPGRA